MSVIIIISTDKIPSEYAAENVLFQLEFVGLPLSYLVSLENSW